MGGARDSKGGTWQEDRSASLESDMESHWRLLSTGGMGPARPFFTIVLMTEREMNQTREATSPGCQGGSWARSVQTHG